MVKPIGLSKRSKKAAEAGKAQASGPEEGGDTEGRILSAARKEFIAKGLEGARMLAIAQEAGVNKALLHYYYRSKDKLYRTVVLDIVRQVWGRIGDQLQATDAGTGLEDLVRTLVSTYLKTLSANPEFPLFMLKEMTSGGAVFQSVLKEAGLPQGDIPARVAKTLQAEARAGRIKAVSPLHFFINIMGMSVATFLTRPVIERLAPMLGAGALSGEAWLEQRIESIVDMAMNGVRTRREA